MHWCDQNGYRGVYESVKNFYKGDKVYAYPVFYGFNCPIVMHMPPRVLAALTVRKARWIGGEADEDDALA